MYVTILSGRVEEENWRTLEKTYEKNIRTTPKGVISSMLIHCKGEPKLWQIVTTWESYDAYEDAKNEKLANTWFDLFCSAGTTPHRNEFEVLGKYTRI